MNLTVLANIFRQFFPLPLYKKEMAIFYVRINVVVEFKLFYDVCYITVMKFDKNWNFPS